MSLSPFKTPACLGTHRATVDPDGRFGWWAYLVLHFIAFVAVAIPSMNRAVQSDSSVSPALLAMFIGCKYTPQLVLAPWLGQWIHKRLNRSKLSVLWILPTSTLFCALMLYSSVCLFQILNYSRVASLFPWLLNYFFALLPLHLVGVVAILVRSLVEKRRQVHGPT